MTAAAVLVAEDLAVSRGERPLFRDLGFSLAAGTALLLRGPNGSGKSTLLRALLGLAGTDGGRLSLDGEPFEPRSGRLRAQAIYLGHASGMKPELPASRALAFAAELDGSPHDAGSLADVLARLGLGRRAALACRQLSQGQRQRLSLGRLMLAGRARPSRRLWLLDEPQTALDSDGLGLFDGLLAGHLAGGGAAIIAAHGTIASGIAGVDTLELGRFDARHRAPAGAVDPASGAERAAGIDHASGPGGPS